MFSTKFREGVYGKGEYQQNQYRDLIGMGIFNTNPPVWKEQRKCAAPLFTTQALKAHGNTEETKEKQTDSSGEENHLSGK